MKTPRDKRSRPKPSPMLDPGGGAGREVLAQTRISKQADEMLTQRANAEAISKAAVMRRLLYIGLGLMKEDKPHG